VRGLERYNMPVGGIQVRLIARRWGLPKASRTLKIDAQMLSGPTPSEPSQFRSLTVARLDPSLLYSLTERAVPICLRQITESVVPAFGGVQPVDLMSLLVEDRTVEWDLEQAASVEVKTISPAPRRGVVVVRNAAIAASRQSAVVERIGLM